MLRKVLMLGLLLANVWKASSCMTSTAPSSSSQMTKKNERNSIIPAKGAYFSNESTSVLGICILSKMDIFILLVISGNFSTRFCNLFFDFCSRSPHLHWRREE